MVTEELIEKVSHLPTTPGVYIWRDQYKKIIYVGKAINIRNRVRSYVRQDKNRAPKVAAMVRRAVDVEIIQTKSEMEALILENTLIKEHHPKYNIMLRDDKTYPYIKVTLQEEFPRVLMTRRMERDGAKYYGPFTDVTAVHQALKVFRQAFPLRTCKNMNVDRPCLQFHMGFCKAPCVGRISKEEYAEYIDQIIDILDGKDVPLIKELKTQMEVASENLEFEKAALYRDRLKSIEKIQEKQRMVTQRGDMDVLGLATEGGTTCLQLFFVRSGRLLGRENFFIPNEGDSEETIMTEFIKQYYGGSSFIPKELLLPLESSEQELITQWFTEMKGQNVEVLVPQRGYKKDMLKMAEENAKTFLAERKRQQQYRLTKSASEVVKRLAEVLDLPRLPERMECYDISHTSGLQTVASMVVFEGGRPAKKEYRKFKLRTVEGKPDDFKSMQEVMERRFGKERNWPKPDLIIVDGGKGQLSSVLEIMRNIGVVDIPTIGLAKELEEVFLEGRSDSILLPRHSQELQVLQEIRDEAHRFAITYHRQLRGKRNLESILDHVPGIGEKRKKALWKTFGTIAEMKKASFEELANTEGMNQKVAEELYRFFRLPPDEKKNYINR